MAIFPFSFLTFASKRSGARCRWCELVKRMEIFSCGKRAYEGGERNSECKKTAASFKDNQNCPF